MLAQVPSFECNIITGEPINLSNIVTTSATKFDEISFAPPLQSNHLKTFLFDEGYEQDELLLTNQCFRLYNPSSSINEHIINKNF